MFDFIPIFLIYPVSFLNTEGLKPLLVISFFSKIFVSHFFVNVKKTIQEIGPDSSDGTAQ
jgi:hypothetical protein